MEKRRYEPEEDHALLKFIIENTNKYGRVEIFVRASIDVRRVSIQLKLPERSAASLYQRYNRYLSLDTVAANLDDEDRLRLAKYHKVKLSEECLTRLEQDFHVVKEDGVITGFTRLQQTAVLTAWTNTPKTVSDVVFDCIGQLISCIKLEEMEEQNDRFQPIIDVYFNKDADNVPINDEHIKKILNAVFPIFETKNENTQDAN